MTLDESASSHWLKQMIRNKIDLWNVANRLNVNRSTVQKILDGRSVSRSITRKIEMVFEEQKGYDKNGPTHGHHPWSRLTVDRLMEVHSLYEEEKSLRSVGRRLGLSRERVRQILEKGSEIGLYRYKRMRPPEEISSPPENGNG